MSEVNPHTHIHVTVYLYMCLYLNLEFGKRADELCCENMQIYIQDVYIYTYIYVCVCVHEDKTLETHQNITRTHKHNNVGALVCVLIFQLFLLNM